MADGLNEILDDLDASMLSDFENYRDNLTQTWEGFDGNHGQVTIVTDYIIEAVHAHVAHAMRRWPYGPNPDDYVEALRNCYDPEVMDRAFSDTLQQSYDEVYDYWLSSMDLQHEHENVMAIMGSSAEPHSTEPLWD